MVDEYIALLIVWKKYRVALSRVTDQTGTPTTIDWPAVSARLHHKPHPAVEQDFFARRKHAN
ncbi:tail fiber assembly protein [Xanthomonas sp. WHRI 1810A]|uniref:tail fiber assembly protein n=1 Tax=Xanthomonas sp. WHRI 1810A TaxID=3161565 RepID=UPI003F885505